MTGPKPSLAPEFTILYAEIDNRLTSERAKIQRQIWILCGLLFVLFSLLACFALLLIPANVIQAVQQRTVPSGAGEADFIKMFIPVFVAAIGFAFGLMGFKRLEQFDTEINNLRVTLISQLADERSVASNEREAFRTSLDKRLADLRQDIVAVAERYAAEAIKSRQEQIRSRLDDFEESATTFIAKAERELKPYAWLREKKEEMDHLVGVSSVGVAHTRVSEFFAADKIDLAMSVVRHALDQKLAGSPTDYHNLTSELGRRDLEPLAAEVVKQGLSSFPNDVDLLANGIKFCGSSGDMVSAERFYQQLRSVEYKFWKWRCFVFAGDYLELLGRIEQAMELYQDFRSQIPDDERGYSQPGQYYRKVGQLSAAIAVLEEGVAKCRRCAQTALALSQCYCDLGQYHKAIAAADRALEANAEDQPSVNQAAVLWHKAAAQDALLNRLVSEKQGEDAQWRCDPDTLRIALECAQNYETSFTMKDCLPHFRVRGEERVAILKSRLKQCGVSEELLTSVFPQAEKTATIPFEALKAMIRGASSEPPSEPDGTAEAGDDDEQDSQPGGGR